MTMQCFPTFSFHGGTLEIIFVSRGTAIYENAENTPALPIAGQKYPRYFEAYLEFFAVF
jgi:hypothetical protein